MTPIEKKDEETACCSLPSLKWSTPGNLPESQEDLDNESRIRKYAYVGIAAASAILVSRFILRVFY